MVVSSLEEIEGFDVEEHKYGVLLAMAEELSVNMEGDKAEVRVKLVCDSSVEDGASE